MRKKYKTKFPVARIKKIMRMDDDVGKVAQALELFMQTLVDETCKETRTRSAKKMTVAHLKKTILSTDKFDFLREIVANIPDPAEKNENAGGSGEGSSGGAGNDEEGGKRGRGGKGGKGGKGRSGGGGGGRKRKETAEEATESLETPTAEDS
ncbi:hypothetical protein HK102_006749, partial [Quaeritorhiza haematococci]